MQMRLEIEQEWMSEIIFSPAPANQQDQADNREQNPEQIEPGKLHSLFQKGEGQPQGVAPTIPNSLFAYFAFFAANSFLFYDCSSLVARQVGELAEFALHLLAPVFPQSSALRTIQHLLAAL